jgi:hypothetical protein
MTREQIDEACTNWICSQENGTVIMARNVWRAAVEWACSHTQWYDAQGDNVPEYGREVIVIGRDGKVFYGHRPNPKEVTMIDGKPYHAKAYDKNGWNWPDIALWLDVEIPHEMVDKIATEYFKEKRGEQ